MATVGHLDNARVMVFFAVRKNPKRKLSLTRWELVEKNRMNAIKVGVPTQARANCLLSVSEAFA